jgi:hypothetical protein
MSNMMNTATARLVYERGLQIITAAKLDPNVVKLTQSDLILEQQVTIASNNYQFPVLNNQSGTGGTTIFNTEVRLVQQNSFIVSAWGFFLCKPTSVNDATWVPQTYPNNQVFTTAGVAAAAQTLYQSQMNITVNNDVVYPIWHTGRHWFVPQTQQTPVIAGVENANQYAQVDLSQDGFFPVEPNLIIIGSKNTVINLFMPAALPQPSRRWSPSSGCGCTTAVCSLKTVRSSRKRLRPWARTDCLRGNRKGSTLNPSLCFYLQKFLG